MLNYMHLALLFAMSYSLKILNDDILTLTTGFFQHRRSKI
jgi:hypothetical protein